MCKEGNHGLAFKGLRDRCYKVEVFLFIFLLCLRLLSVFGVKPGNAPDEIGHMVMVSALSQGKLLTLSECLKYSSYPYAIYNPTPYLPHALGLAIASVFRPGINILAQPVAEIEPLAVYSARLGGIFWFLVFAFFLLRLTREIPLRFRVLTVGLIGLLPQLTFVQSYVNLDSMGPAVMLYLLWTLKEKRWGHTSFAVFLVLMSKLNFYCLLALPAWFVLQEKRGRVARVVQVLLIPGGLASLWFVYNYFVNTGQYQSVTGFGALNSIFSSEPSGLMVLKPTFISVSLRSAFGLFGYMDQPMHPAFTLFWRLVICPVGLILALYFNFLKGQPKEKIIWHRAFLALFAFNWILHYGASFTGSYQPQGRYLFPAIFVLLGYLAYGVYQLQERRTAVAHSLLAWMLVSSVVGLYVSSQDPFHHGF